MNTFKVNFDVGPDEMTGKTVLVFLKPQNPQRSYMIHAWQVLNGSAGTTESFQYEEVISTDVSDIGKKPTQSISGRQSIVPGQLLSAVSPNGLSSLLREAPASLAQTKLIPDQCGVINQTKVSASPLAGPNYVAQNLPDITQYAMPIIATEENLK